METRGPGVIMFESKELHLYANHKFEYVHWTDMVGVGQQGKGTYALHGQQLRLHFNGQSLAKRTVLQQHALLAQPASDSVTVRVDLLFGKDTPEGLTLLVLDEAGHILAGTSSNKAGQAYLTLARQQRPQHFTINGAGFQKVDQPWPLTSTAYTVQLAEILGPTSKAGKVLSFQVLQQTATKLLLQQGSNTIVLAMSLRP
ncbi:MAG: hypothetical protein ACRYGH_08635 [Janthinobacterium lividum]